MARVVVTIEIMPDDIATNLETLQNEAEKKITAFGGDVGKVMVEPVAFGLKVIKILFVMDEAKGTTDPLEKSIAELKGVSSVKVSDVRRTVG